MSNIPILLQRIHIYWSAIGSNTLLLLLSSMPPPPPLTYYYTPPPSPPPPFHPFRLSSASSTPRTHKPRPHCQHNMYILMQYYCVLLYIIIIIIYFGRPHDFRPLIFRDAAGFGCSVTRSRSAIDRNERQPNAHI